MSSKTERETALKQKIERSIEVYKKLGDVDFVDSLLPHLKVYSISIIDTTTSTLSPETKKNGGSGPARRGGGGGGGEGKDITATIPRVTFAYTVQPEHCNKNRTLHGGAAATLFDWCTSMPIALVRRPDFWSTMGVSRSLSVNYLRPVPAGETVLIECEVVQIGRRLCALRGVMRREKDGLVVSTCDHAKFNTDPPAGSKV